MVCGVGGWVVRVADLCTMTDVFYDGWVPAWKRGWTPNHPRLQGSFVQAIFLDSVVRDHCRLEQLLHQLRASLCCCSPAPSTCRAGLCCARHPTPGGAASPAGGRAACCGGPRARRKVRCSHCQDQTGHRLLRFTLPVALSSSAPPLGPRPRALCVSAEVTC